MNVCIIYYLALALNCSSFTLLIRIFFSQIHFYLNGGSRIRAFIVKITFLLLMVVQN